MSIIKYFILLCLAFTVTFLITISIYFADIKNDVIDKFSLENKASALYLEQRLSKLTLTSDFSSIQSTLHSIVNTKNFNEIEVKFTDFLFLKESLLRNSNNIRDNKWKISDVTIDAGYGEIERLSNNTYRFLANSNYKLNESIYIKFQAFNKGIVENSISKLKFYHFVKKDLPITSRVESTNTILSSIINLDTIDLSKIFSLKYNDLVYADVKYTLDANEVYKQIEISLEKLLTYSFVLFILTFTILFYYNRKVIKHDIVAPILSINGFLDDMAHNRYVKIDKNSYKINEMASTFNNLQLLSKKIMSLTNELNISRDVLERKEYTDELTGLPNKKIFEKDLQSMRVTNASGYIILAKINNLGQHTNEHGSNEANHLLEDFASTINNILKNKKYSSTTFYRFYGAEFAIIIKKSDQKIIVELLNQVVSSLKSVEEKHMFYGDLVYFGATPFDVYGTVDSMLNSAFEAYKVAVENKQIYFHISDNAALLEKSKELEDTVSDIIKRDDFVIKYVFDTYEFDPSDKLVMQEVTPILINSTTYEKFPIGTFISVAEKLKLTSQFDKLLIGKVIQQLESREVTHKIAINISVRSFTDRRFLSWLEGTLLYSKEAQKYLVFGVTAFTAAANLAQFKNLIEVLHKFDTQILLKCFTLDSFDLETVKEFNLDYIRIDKSYSMDMNMDNKKKHNVRNIILFGEENDIVVLGDNIKSQEDYDTMNRLGLYATSR